MRSPRALWFVVCLSLVSLSIPSFLSAQGTSGRILGRVSDPACAVLPNTRVALVNEATGVSRDARTNEGGDYDFVEVPVGTYRLEFDLTGFKKNVRHGVSLDINQVITLNMTMQLGATQEVVDVTSEAPLVETTSTQLGESLDTQKIEGVPLNGRSFTDLMAVQPGIVPQNTAQPGAVIMTGVASTPPSGDANPGNLSISGQRESSNGFRAICRFVAFIAAEN